MDSCTYCILYMQYVESPMICLYVKVVHDAFLMLR